MVDMLHSQMRINVTLSHIVVLIFLLLIVQPYFKSRDADEVLPVM